MEKSLKNLAVFYSALVFGFVASAQIGPPTGGVDHFYDDGYVRVDVSGNAGNLTWFWGYLYAEQFTGTDIEFHAAVIDDGLATKVTDRYSLNGAFPPPPPYSGTFSGSGPVISDIPIRTTETFPLVENVRSGTNLVIKWSTNAPGFRLQSNTNFNLNSWIDVTNSPSIVSNRFCVTNTISGENKFFRLLNP